MMSRSRFWAFQSKKFPTCDAIFLQPLFFFIKSSSLLQYYSSSSYPPSRKPSSSSLHNYYLRKRRKWPLPNSPHHLTISLPHQLAMEALFKESAAHAHLLSALIHSFAAYDCQPSPKAFHFIIKTLIRNGKPDWEDQIAQVLDHLEKVATFETPEYIFIDLIKSYGSCGMTNHAVHLFFRIPNFRCTPSVDSLNALLSVLCNQKCGLDLVPGILMKSGRVMNIRLESSILDVLIRGLCRFRKVNHAVELLNFAVSEGFHLDGELFSLILGTMCEDKSCINIMSFLEDLKKLGFVPSKVDWCNIIRFMVKKGNGVEAMAGLKQMRKEGKDVDIVCCNWVLSGLVKGEEYLMADQLFDEMLVWGLVPDIHTYNAHIRALCKQNSLEQAIKMLDCMEELGCRPDSSTYETVLGACCRKGELIMGGSVISKMERKGVKLINLEVYKGMRMMNGQLSESSKHTILD